MANTIQTYRKRPIPNLNDYRRKKVGYRKWPIDDTHPLYTEPLEEIGVHGLAGQNYYYQVDNPPYYQRISGSIPDLLLRTSVIRRLRKLDEQLKENGLELFVLDGYRPIAVQNYFYFEWVPAYLRRSKPTLSPEQIQLEVEKYWAAGARNGTIDPTSPPPHSTGGAVDLTIRKTKTGEHLFMGSIVDDASELAHADFLEKAAYQNMSSDEAKMNRRLLYWIMREHGFANNPTEWWHFSFGDQMWAKLEGVPAAMYSCLAPPGFSE